MESINNQFTHFKVHTQYSICEGALKIENLKIFCKENKIRSVGLSDTSNLCGALEFSENISKSMYWLKIVRKPINAKLAIDTLKVKKLKACCREIKLSFQSKKVRINTLAKAEIELAMANPTSPNP